jgi:hypothetical protein
MVGVFVGEHNRVHLRGLTADCGKPSLKLSA